MRECGECTACCYNCKVDELNKPARTMCGNCTNGCSIYATRPHSCKTFECAWLQGEMFDDQRPDKCGVMIENHGQFRFAMCETDEWKSIEHILKVYVQKGIPVVIGSKTLKTMILKPDSMTEEHAVSIIKGL